MFGGFLKAAVYSLPFTYFPIDKSAMPTRIDIASSGSDDYEYGSDGVLYISRPFLSYDFFYKDHALDSLYRLNIFDYETYSYEFEYDDSQRVVKSRSLLLPEGNTATTAIEYFLPDSIVRKREWKNPPSEEDSSRTVLHLKNGLLVKRVQYGSTLGIPDTDTAIFTYAASAALVKKDARNKESFRYSPIWMRYDIAGRQRKARR